MGQADWSDLWDDPKRGSTRTAGRTDPRVDARSDAVADPSRWSVRPVGQSDPCDLTLGLRGEDAGAQQPDFVARQRRFMVRPFAEFAGPVIVAELEVTSTHLVVEPGALQRRLRHRQSHVPAVHTRPTTTTAVSTESESSR